MNMDFGSLLLNESPDAVVATTPEGQILYWSKGAEIVFGYTSTEAVGRTLDELIVPTDRSGEESEMVRQTLRSGGATYESLRKCKDGSLVYVDITSKSVRDAQGKVQYVLSSQKDVTHLKVLRDAKLVEARFRDLLESTPDGIVIVNPTGRIVLANSQAEDLSRRSSPNCKRYGDWAWISRSTISAPAILRLRISQDSRFTPSRSTAVSSPG